METQSKFHWADYLLFALSLLVTVVIGIVIAYRDKWYKQSKESYLMANRNMHWLLVGLSAFNTVQTGVSFIGMTSEFYYNGMITVWYTPIFIIGGTLTALLIVPKFHRLGFVVTSIYEYLEYRFNLPLRIVVGMAFVFVNALDMSVNLYIPSIALSQVATLNLYWCLALGAFVCLIYTGFGGMKGVIWVDTVQLLIIAFGMGALAIKGVHDAGGMGNVWDVYQGIGERNNWNDIDPEPWDRHTVWGLFLLLGISNFATLGVNQTAIQRILSVPSMRKAQLSVFVYWLISIPFVTIVVIVSLAAFANLGGNEPMLTGETEKSDQIIPHFLMYALGTLHGLPGLVIAALFAAALSTLSSIQNSVVTVLIEDIITPFHKIRTKHDFTDKVQRVMTRVLGLVVGVLVLLLSLIVPQLGVGVMTLALGVKSFFKGPMLGVMLCGFFFFWVEAWGALAGFVASVAWAVMLFYTSRVYSQRMGRDQSPQFWGNFTEKIEFPNPTMEPTLFDVSYLWYTLIDAVIVMVVGTIVSLFVHCCRHGRLRKSDMMPPVEYLYKKEDFLIAIGVRKNDRHPARNPKEDDINDNREDEREKEHTNGYINSTFEHVESTNM